MATVSVQTVDQDGLTATYSSAAGGGDKFAPGERTFLHVKNGNAATCTVTVVTPKTSVGGLAIADQTVAVAAGAQAFVGPFAAEHFAGTDGLVDVTWSVTTTVTFAALRI